MEGFFLYLRVLVFSCLFFGCADSDKAVERGRSFRSGRINRLANEPFFIPPPKKEHLEPYPWDEVLPGDICRITKEFFRCKGSSLNPELVMERNGKIEKIKDCSGGDRHSLPIIRGKERVYPILIDILNYLQVRADKKVVITSGHRCPEHNTYVDPSWRNINSKHMIGAEVSFYIRGMEYRPEEVVNMIIDYYGGEKERDFREFKKYDGVTNVSVKPWYNREIFIKLFKKDEGRDLDNRHPYPYISLQVRFDRDVGEKVVYSREQATKILRE